MGLEDERLGAACGRDPPERARDPLLPERLLLGLALGFDPPDRDGERLGFAFCFDPPERGAGGRAWLPPRELEPEGCRAVERGASLRDDPGPDGLRVVALFDLPEVEGPGDRTFRPVDPGLPAWPPELFEPALGVDRSRVVRGAAALRYRSRTRSALCAEPPRPDAPGDGAAEEPTRPRVVGRVALRPGFVAEPDRSVEPERREAPAGP